MTKKIMIGARPAPKAEPAVPGDEWVENRGAAPEETCRLTFDVPVGLHRAIKADCAGRGKKMNGEIISMLEARWRPKTAE